MKKYGICLFLLLLTSIVCLFTGFFITRNSARQEEPIPNVTIETETVTEDRVVLNQKQIEPVVSAEETAPAKRYYLVSEDGFLLVFCEDRATVCLYTHMPISDFPQTEQDKLREGIWFETMIEVFNYLESYTS
ncbi:hypothetical protein GPL15_24300 [Clostridium sp. MCC353]|uniref:hypothetical protein n=1 Tax=Clostridium sp. MCC353 TaxID=2592646 RepID=UPI001C01922F|nr:hypothetical protein [Clostridium sp. MCC353]MBT9779605.1 hypothetical protein [Clostridium sp. MCC353]